MGRVYDCFPFFNELDLLEIRLNELDAVVDRFVLVEATRTFQKKEKPLIFEQNKERFSKYLHKIDHIIVDKYPNFFTHFRVPKTWDYENHQRDHVMLGLKSCQPDDIIILSDVDEIPNPEMILKFKDTPGIKVFQQKMYWYFLDNFIVDYDEPIALSEEGFKPWNGPVMCFKRDFKNVKKMRSIRNRADMNLLYIPNGGWHYGWMGGIDKVIQKMEAYAHKEHNKSEFKNSERIKEIITSGADLFGRNVKSKIVDPFEQAPKYLRENSEKYLHLTLAGADKITKKKGLKIVNILVTGGAGYIGSHATKILLSAGFKVVILDNFSTGFLEAIPPGAKVVTGDVCDYELLKTLLVEHSINAVIHFAAKLNVKESTEKPIEYFHNNTGGMVNLLRACEAANVNKIVFSSTAAIFGEPSHEGLIFEDTPKSPINPYGLSKLMSEQLLEAQSQIKKMKYVALRYFNVAGASDDGFNGQRTANAYHLIHIASQAASRKRNGMSMYGVNYPTPDGTCIRDYIHVEDLGEIHLLALRYLLAGGESDQFNCGYGVGYSVKQVIDAMKKVSGVDFEVKIEDRRPGDPSFLVAGNDKLLKKLKWAPKRNDIELICRSAYLWECKR